MTRHQTSSRRLSFAHRLLGRIDRAFGQFYELLGTAVGISIAGFVIGISLDLLLRQLGVSNVAGVQEVIEYVLFAGVFLTAPWILRLGAHVRVDLLLTSLPATALRWCERLVDIVGFICCAAMTWYSWVNLSNSRMFNSMQMKFFNVPEWWLLSVVLMSFSLLALEFMFRLFRLDQDVEGIDDLEKGL